MLGLKLIALTLLLALASGCRTFSRSSDPPPIDQAGEPSRMTLRDLSPRKVRSNVRNAMGLGPNEEVARGLYEEGDRLFQQAADASGADRSKLFGEAAAKYAAAAERWPDSMLQEDALLMRAESLFFADRYREAQKAYDQIVKDFPNTRHIDRVDARRFDIAQYWLAIHRHNPRFFLSPNWPDEKLPFNDAFGNSMRVFDKIRLDDPTGRLADDATMAAGSAYFASGQYDKADRFFGDLRTTYPESQHQFDAMLLSIKAKTLLYQGSDYDSQDLEEALALIELLFQQFPKRAAEEREYLETAYKDIRVKLAVRDWETARYYDNRHEYGGARFYYSKIIRDFPDTSLAEDAQRRLAAITEYPDKPPQRMQWLVDNIPKPERQSAPLVTGNPLQFLQR